VTHSALYLNPSEAARRLGVSAKTLRLYEQRGLLMPLRTSAGWRTYGPTQISRAKEILALRGFGLSLMAVERVLHGDVQCLEQVLAQQQAALEQGIGDTVAAVERIRLLRQNIAAGHIPSLCELAGLSKPVRDACLSLELPWPWDGELFELIDIHPITYIVGPLGSGKTRLARAIAAALPNAVFLGLDRLAEDGSPAHTWLDGDPALKAKVESASTWLVEEGASPSAALTALLAWTEADEPACLVVDMVEQALDRATQEALISYLRLRCSPHRPLFLMTRSSSILDLEVVGSNEAILFCPANHSVPTVVQPYPGAPGYEALSTCLATPEVRARSHGVIAFRPTA